MDTNHQFWLLNDVNLFDVMCPNKVANDSEKAVQKVYNKGDIIYFTEDPANTMYLISSGKVKILNYTDQGDEVIRAILSKGEMFGELALLGEEKRGETAQALEDDTTMCAVHKDQVHQLMKEDHDFSFKIYKWIGLRMRKLERRIDSLIFKDVRSRLIDFLKELASERGLETSDGVVIENFFTHKNLASLLGTSRQTITTTLNEMRDEGLIDFGRKKIVLKKAML